MQTYYNMLVDVATILGAEPSAAKREMRELIQFETDLAEVSINYFYISIYFSRPFFCPDHDPSHDEKKLLRDLQEDAHLGAAESGKKSRSRIRVN